MMRDSEELLRAALAKAPAGLAEHVLRVLDEATRLAAFHGVDPEAVKLAVLGHDILRAHAPGRLPTIAAEQGYAMEESERMEPLLLHGPLAVPILREQYHVHDADVLGAVAAHTTAAPGMSPLAKLIFLADKVEPEKLERRPAAARVRDLAAYDLDAALLAYLDLLVLEAVEGHWPLHSNTVAARNELLKARRPSPLREPPAAR
ncbi:MAG: bis(5'-nucleosyl)-tetraphosphatase (symmetrical) YqeK [Dehalococcoidia bacterium]